jgi:hypothetical protein
MPMWHQLLINVDSYEQARRYDHSNQHWGWKLGLEQMGLDVDYNERPSYLIPTSLTQNWSLYVFLLQIIYNSTFLKFIDRISFNIYLSTKIIVNGPDFVLISNSNTIMFPIERLCESIGCDLIDFFGDAPANTTTKRKVVPYSVDYVLTGYPLSKLYPTVPTEKFLEIRQGPPESFKIPESKEKVKDIDILVFGTFDDQIFTRRSEIVNEFLVAIKPMDLTARVIGSLREGDNFAVKYPDLYEQMEPPKGGEEFQDLLQRSKIVINIPADQHIKIEAQRPKAIFECAASRTMQLHYETQEVKQIFETGIEIDHFRNVDELVKKTKYYLTADETREAMASKSYERFQAEYTAEKQIQRVFKRIY